MSDHRHIRFDIVSNKPRCVEHYRNPRATDWEGYKDDLKHDLEQVKTIQTGMYHGGTKN